MVLLVVSVLASGCVRGVNRELQSPAIRAVVRSCFEHGANKSYTTVNNLDVVTVSCQFPLMKSQP